MVPIVFVGIGISMMYNYFTFETGLTICLVSILAISAGIVFGFFILKRSNDNLTFISIPLAGDIDDVSERITQHFKVSKIEINRNLNCIYVWTKITAFSWGELMTLILSKDNIFINSRPASSNQPFTIIKDRKNIKKLVEIL